MVNNIVANALYILTFTLVMFYVLGKMIPEEDIEEKAPKEERKQSSFTILSFSNHH